MKLIETGARCGQDSKVVFLRKKGIEGRQHSTGGKAKLSAISKRDNRYLRKILVHGARSAVLRVKRERSPFGAWPDALELRAPINVVITAANKLARIAWAVLSSGQEYPSCKPHGCLTLPHRDDDLASSPRSAPDSSRKWSSMTVPFIRKSTQPNSSSPGESALHLIGIFHWYSSRPQSWDASIIKGVSTSITHSWFQLKRKPKSTPT
jgi:hypothetical protein